MSNIEGMQLRIVEYRYDFILCEDISSGMPGSRYITIEPDPGTGGFAKLIINELKPKEIKD